MKTSQELKNIMPAFIKAQTQIGHAAKDGNNPHFKSKYATLESVIDASKEALAANNIVVCQSVTADNTLVTTLLHESGEFLESEIKLLLNKQDMQQLGSAITYARRYALSSMLNMAQEDDDGISASNGKGTTNAPPTAQVSKSQQVDALKARPITAENVGKHLDDVRKVQGLLEDPGQFVYPAGAHKGKKLNEMTVETVIKNMDFWTDKKKAGSVPPDITDFLNNGYEYLVLKGVYPKPYQGV